jgi:hypothetical protein
MTSNFSINHVFESKLEADFTIDDGVFINNGDSFILAHPYSLKNVVTLLENYDTTIGVDADNYFNKEYRISTDNITFGTWLPMLNDFSNITIPTTDFWIQFRYTFVSNLTVPNPITLQELFFTGERRVADIFEPTIIPANETRVFSNADTYKVFNITGLQLFTSSNADINVYLRFTQSQGRHWSEWVKATDENLANLEISKIKFCDFQFAFENTSNVDVSLFDMELIGEFQNITADYQTIARLGLKTQCNPLLNGVDANSVSCDASGNINSAKSCQPCSASETPWNTNLNDCTDGCTSKNYTQLNDRNLWAAQIKTYNELNDYINSVNSWKVTYLLTDPDAKGIDKVLHEEQIHNVIKMGDINIVVPKNQFMHETINFSGLDLDLIQSFEVHIMKNKFKDTFGVEFRPSTRDVIYFCDMNQLWEVERMFPQRGFMHAETYYRVLLKKYNDRASRKYANTQDGQDAKQLIDALTKHTTLDGLFGFDVDNEIKKVTKDDIPITDGISSHQHTPTTDISVRSEIHPDVIISKHELRNATLTLSTTRYEMPIKSKNKKLVKYVQKDNLLTKGSNRAISFWFKTEDYSPTYEWDLFNNFDTVNNAGYKLKLANNVLELQLNNGIFQMNANLKKDIWYCILANIDQTKEQIELAIYKRQNENGIILNDSQLVLVNKLKFNINPFEFDIDNVIYIGGADTHVQTGNSKKWYITNIRLWNTPVPTKKRKIVLNEQVVSDSQLTILVDNAEPVLNLPKYGNF